MTHFISLTQRLHNYLSQKGDGQFVSRVFLQKKAYEQNFSSKDFFNALKKLEEELDIGKTIKDKQVFYCWYFFTKEELLQKQNFLKICGF